MQCNLSIRSFCDAVENALTEGVLFYTPAVRKLFIGQGNGIVTEDVLCDPAGVMDQENCMSLTVRNLKQVA
jgi:hypothetical protein